MSSVRLLGRCTALSFVFALGCNSGQGGLAVASLTRPGDIAFACFDETTSSFLPTLAECAGVTGDNDETLHMISFVVETTRGEVGAVDWQSVRAIDSNRTVPGYTFVRVGEAPSAIIVPENDSRMTFVANYGSFSVQSLETAAFVPEAAQDVDDVLHPSLVTLPSGPSDLLYFESGGARWLVAPLPDLGSIAQIPVNADGSLGAPVVTAVSTTLPVQVAPVAGPEFIERCPEGSFVRPATAALRTPVSLGAVAKPGQVGLVTRAGSVEIVASDAALPVIHRFTVSAGGITEIPGFAVAVPTLDLIATPLVPDTDQVAPTPLSPSKQFVYAIDATDRSVLVVDVATGEVVPVNDGDRASDRVSLGSRSIGLEIFVPGYDLAADPTLVGRCDPANTAETRRDDATQTALRGVFVAASRVDGLVSIIDIFDMDAQCRGTVACGGAGNANDEIVSIRRHRPRLASLIVTPTTVVDSLSFSYDSNAGGLASTGRPTSGTGPALVPIDDGDAATAYCPGNAGGAARGQMMTALVSTGDAAIEGQPLVCLLDDPNALRPQVWQAIYEGSVPTASGVRGRFVDASGVHRFDTEDGAFCDWGVLGGADVTAAALAATDPESGYGGDMLVVESDVSPELASSDACSDLVIPTGSTRRIRIAFAILEAHTDHLVLGDFVPDSSFTLASRFNENPAGAFDLVRACFPSLVRYSVRIHGAYVVAGGDSVPRHRVIDGGAGRCVIDLANHPYDPAQPDSARAFRALPGRLFVHPQVAFQISDFAVPSGIPAVLTIRIVWPLRDLRLDGGVLEPALRFNPADQRAYIVDTASHAVTQWDLDPIVSVHRVQ